MPLPKGHGITGGTSSIIRALRAGVVTFVQMEFKVHPLKDVRRWCARRCICSPFLFILHFTCYYWVLSLYCVFISCGLLSGGLEVLRLRIYPLPSRRIRSSLENSHIVHVSAFFDNTSTYMVGYSPSYYMPPFALFVNINRQ